MTKPREKTREERRERNHRLIVRGATFESIVPEANTMTDEEAAVLLRLALNSVPAQEYLKKRAEIFISAQDTAPRFDMAALPQAGDATLLLRQLALSTLLCTCWKRKPKIKEMASFRKSKEVASEHLTQIIVFMCLTIPIYSAIIALLLNLCYSYRESHVV